MKLCVALCIFGLTVCVYGFSIDSSFKELSEDLNIDNELMDMEEVEGKGHCHCNRFGCWCHAVDAGVQVHAVFSVDECRHNNPKAEIEGTFFVGNKSIKKQFPVGQFEDFCEDFGKKRFCFRVDIKSKSGDVLEGCLRMSRPQKIDMGCFNLPLMTSSKSEESKEEYEMEVPAQLAGIVDGRRKCMCCEHGCACHGTDDGFKVVVVLSLDECNHDSHHKRVIDGLFRVGNATFERELDAEQIKSFCHKTEGKIFCFRIKLRHGCGCHIRGSIALTRPKRVNLGDFSFPLLTSSSEDDSYDDVTSENDEFISSDADEERLLFLRNKGL